MPISTEQLNANRANAKKSTGPRSPDGKQASSRNSTTHGLHSRRFIVEPHQQEAFETLRTTLRAEILPLGALEVDAFQQLLHAAWQLRRSDTLEDRLYNPEAGPEDQLTSLERLSRLRGALERSYQRAWRRLRELQTTRAAELILSNPTALAHTALTPVAPPPKPAKPSEISPLKRSHFEPSTELFQMLETQAASGALPLLPLRALLRICHQLTKKAAELAPPTHPTPEQPAA